MTARTSVINLAGHSRSCAVPTLILEKRNFSMDFDRESKSDRWLFIFLPLLHGRRVVKSFKPDLGRPGPPFKYQGCQSARAKSKPTQRSLGRLVSPHTRR